MASTTTTPAAFAGSAASSREHSTSIPWYLWLATLGVTSAIIGAQWDISWHKSIGRDTFWTPAHLAIQLCGVIAGITCGYLILATTFTKSALRAASVNVFGFRGPLGAFICAWGGFAMITSAPFDDWWHNAYGLDVKILSPPHVLLALGVVMVQAGALMLICAQMNRESGAVRGRLENLFLYICGMISLSLLTVVLELTSRFVLHSSVSYRAVGILIPLVLAVASRATGRRWAATLVAGIYSAVTLGLLWILPLFPAEPKLGPVMHPVHQFIPNGFPLLLIAPAFALDLLWPRLKSWPAWRQAIVGGVVFLAVYWAIEWPFADFLQSSAARNWFFGSHYEGYFVPENSYQLTYRFAPWDKSTAQFLNGMAIAFVCSIVSMWLGLGAGEWLKRVRR